MVPQDPALVAGHLHPHQGPMKPKQGPELRILELELDLRTLELGTLEPPLDQGLKDFSGLKSFILKDARRGRETRY